MRVGDHERTEADQRWASLSLRLHNLVILGLSDTGGVGYREQSHCIWTRSGLCARFTRGEYVRTNALTRTHKAKTQNLLVIEISDDGDD